MRRTFTFRLMLNILLLAFFVSAARADEPRHVAVGSFEVARDNGTPVLQVKFGDNLTGRFLLDTGSYECLMSDAFAKKLGYAPDHAQPTRLETIYGFSLEIPAYFSAHVVTAGDLRVRELQFRVVDKNSLPALGGLSVDGTLGGTLLSRFALLLDYPRHTVVWIHPGNLEDREAAQLGFDPKSRLGLHQELVEWAGEKINHYSLSARLKQDTQERSEEMFLDTGSPISTISAETAHRLALKSIGVEPYQFLFQAPDLACKAPVSELHLGSQTLANITVIFPSHRDVKMVSLIGENVLGNGVALFDFGPHHFYFKPVLPGVTAEAAPLVDGATVDWNRLRNSPDLPSVSELLNAGLNPEVFEGLPARLSRLCAAMTGDAADKDRYRQIGLLLQDSKDAAGAQAAENQAVMLCREDCRLHPDDVERECNWVSALTFAGQDQDALSLAQKNTERWPQSASAWCTLGEAQEWAAAHLFWGKWNKIITEDEALAPFPSLDILPDKPDAARLQQIEALRRQARDNYDKFVALSPLETATYRGRARFWILDRWLLSLMHTVEVKGQSLSEGAALAAELSDYRSQLQFGLTDVDTLRRFLLLDASLPAFHDKDWLREELHGTGQGLGKGEWITAQSVQTRLTALSQSADKSVAAPALDALGAVQQAQNDPAAEASWRRALALDPTQTQALRGLAGEMLEENRLGDLRDLLTGQIAQTDTFPLRLLLAATLKTLGQAGDAETQARAALKIAPDNPVANLTLAGLLLARSGTDQNILTESSACLDKARDGFGPLATPEQKSSLRTMQAVLLALTKDPTTARQQLLDLARDQPTCTQAREALAALTLPAP